MQTEATSANAQWYSAGQEMFAAMLAAIEAAQESICLETYIFAPGPLGERFRHALTQARLREARVRVLIDALGSYGLAADYWRPLEAAGGEVRQFNPLSLHRCSIRNHRKLMVCDRQVAFIGGFNISSEYEGDGISSGWCDLGLRIAGTLAAQLETSFDEMFARADFLHRRFVRLRKSGARKVMLLPHEQLLLSGPGRGRNPINRALRLDLACARSVQIMVAYFLPTWRLRRQLVRIARNGCRVQLLLPGKSDVAVSLLAAQSLYRRMLKGGVEVYEYQPQILHAKLIIIDDVVYVGSANLDQRSLAINYELMVRFESREMAAQAREVFGRNLQHSRRLTLEIWAKSRSFWRRLKQRWAYLLLVRLDPYIARWQWRSLARPTHAVRGSKAP